MSSNGMELYNDEIIDDIIWILRKLSIADAMTKATILLEVETAI